jgi:phosphoglycerate-specific signal transduction histidine kinase
MTGETFREEFDELESRIATLPSDQQATLRPLLQETRERHLQIEQAITAAKDTLDDWRIAMKYLIFDIEARRREVGQ